MKVRKAIKKLVALGIGAVMVGSTIMGAMAADLGNYPAPFAKDGKFDGLIVVGEKAASMDVVGAIDIATSLQYAVKQTQTINVGTAAGGFNIAGDAAAIGSGSDLLEIDEKLGNVKETMTENDLALLKGGIVTTNAGTTDYNQFLRFKVGADESMEVLYLKEDTTDVVGDYLYAASDAMLFEYELQFEEGFKSSYTNTSGEDTLTDFEDETLTILGKAYSLVQAKADAQQIALTLLGGDVTDTLYEGETKSYTINGVDYEVMALIVADNTNNGAGSVKLKVNGEVTKELADGQTERLSDGTEIGIRDILPNEGTEEGGGDLVEFYIGANKLKLTDTDFTSAAAYNGIEVNDQSIEDAELWITATDTGSKITINSIKFKLKADGLSGDVYIGEGEGLRENLDEPEGMFSTGWDIEYHGLMDTGVSEIKFNPQGDDAYKLVFTTREGLDYNVPFLDGSTGSLLYGDDDQVLWFMEEDVAGDEVIDKRDYFIVTSASATEIDAGSDSAYTHVLRYDSIDTTNRIVTFTDLASGQLEAVYDTSYDGSLVVGGTTFAFTVDSSNSKLAVDLDGDGNVTGNTETLVVTESGAILDLGTQTAATGAPGSATVATVGYSIESKRFDEPSSDLDTTFNITVASSKVDIAVDTGITLLSVEGQDLKRGMDLYGSFYEKTDNTNDADSLVIESPLSQRGVLVYVTGGDTTTTKVDSASGTVETVTLEKINVGAAKLDSEISNVWAQNLILVGGPCANKAALTVMDKTADTCSEGFMEGKAMVKLYEKSGKVAMVVAGYSAEDTRRATRVVADYEKYASKLSGEEVEITGTSLTDISISQPTME